MAKINIEQLSKSFGDTHILHQVDLSIEDGEFMTLVGPSGCGKSTLLRIIAGLEVQSTGHIRIGETLADNKSPANRNLSMVFQSYALYPHLSVYDNIATPLRLRNSRWYQRLPVIQNFLPSSDIRRAEIDKKINQVADLLQIKTLLNRKPGELSGGQRQRVALGRAMVRNPDAFLMDEPLSNLDAKLRVHMRTEIAQLHRQLGTTFIYVTHDQAEAMTMSDRIALMMDGEIIQVATPKEIYHNPSDIRVAEFIGSPKINLIPATLTDAGLIKVCHRPLQMTITSYSEDTLILGIRPENASLCASAEGELQGTLVYLENMGSEFFAHISITGLEKPMVVRCSVEESQELQLDKTVGICINLGKMLLFNQQGLRFRNTQKTQKVTAVEPINHCA